jgi:hypothetical protein
MDDRITVHGITDNGITKARTTDADSLIATMKYAGAIGEKTGMNGIAATSIAATAAISITATVIATAETAITTVAVTSATATNPPGGDEASLASSPFLPAQPSDSYQSFLQRSRSGSLQSVPHCHPEQAFLRSEGSAVPSQQSNNNPSKSKRAACAALTPDT